MERPIGRSAGWRHVIGGGVAGIAVFAATDFLLRTAGSVPETASAVLAAALALAVAVRVAGRG
jgi:hypothetical protein